MQANHVELPPEELIEPRDLVAAIVKAFYPEKTENLTGIECIEGKLLAITFARPSKNLDLNFGTKHDPDGKTLFNPIIDSAELPPQLELPLQRVEFTQDLLAKGVEDENSVKFSLPYRLTDEDRKALEPLLSCLPPLTFPMTDHAYSRFLDAYLALPQRPPWVSLTIKHRQLPNFPQLASQQLFIPRRSRYILYL